MAPDPYPLRFTPLLFPKVWGGDRFARFGKDVKPGDRIGESWELADLEQTSASGAGGAPAVSIIANGPLAGKTLRDAANLWGRNLLGDLTPASRFPLLVKYLDARENLSVQVHPSITYAKTHPGSHIKTECWYILDAEPGSVIYKGVKPGVTRESFERRLREGDGAAVVDDLESVPAVPGEMHNLPSGTVHALGAGVLVAEVQTPSDTTFRVYDWGRVGRQLHIEQALECIHFGRARDATRLPPGATEARLVSTGFFTVDELVLRPRESRALARDDERSRPIVVMAIAGKCVIRASDRSFADVEAPLGSTVLIPALPGRAALAEGEGRILRVGVLGS